MPRPKQPDPGRHVRELLAATEPTEYPAFFDHLLALAVAVREELAARLSPKLSAQVRTMPHETYAEKPVERHQCSAFRHSAPATGCDSSVTPNRWIDRADRGIRRRGLER